jgi:Holliday junction resolvasome RuvABC endonuclease subunit
VSWIAYVGIDPGLSGAMALLSRDEKILELTDMPVFKLTKNKRSLDIDRVVGVLEDWRGFHGAFRVMLERQQSMPQQGVSSTFTTGVGFGSLLGVLAAQKVRHEIVSPAAWKKSIFGAGKHQKGASGALCSRLWPGTDLGRRQSHDRSDALLIALYGLRNDTSTNGELNE